MKPRTLEIDCRYFDDSTQINIFELSEGLPFQAKRVYTIQSHDIAIERGHHSHLNQEQIIYVLNGKCLLTLESPSKERYTFQLINNGIAVLIPRKHWITLKVEKSSTLLCIASKAYKDLLSCYDKEVFFKKI